MQRMICLLALALAIAAAPAQDKIVGVPGFGADYKTDVYSGYLNTGNANRSLHYVFVESAKGKGNSDPVTLWLNGGPGCSSLLGYLQEIGPYFLEDGVNYKLGDKLIPNPDSWHKVSNLIFLESPAGVGYSYNLDTAFQYNDAITANDSYNALLHFFQLYPEYAKNKFFIAGQSYAGKYIPDLAVLIDKNRNQNKFPLAAILVGNGLMTFDTLEASEIEFIIKKEMVDPEILPLYEKYCKKDFESDGCQTFLEKYDKDTEGLNPYSIYDYCFYNDTFDTTKTPKQKKVFLTQESILNKLKEQFAPKRKYNFRDGDSNAPCAYFDGVFNYFNLNGAAYRAKFGGMQWNGPCADNITYNADADGSMESYRYLISRKMNVVLYNGNADAMVPFIDTYKGMNLLKLYPTSPYQPWFTNDQHSGFIQNYAGNFVFAIFKGASHQVPQAKRPESLKFFTQIITNYKAQEQHQQLSVDQQ